MYRMDGAAYKKICDVVETLNVVDRLLTEIDGEPDTEDLASIWGTVNLARDVLDSMTMETRVIDLAVFTNK